MVNSRNGIFIVHFEIRQKRTRIGANYKRILCFSIVDFVFFVSCISLSYSDVCEGNLCFLAASKYSCPVIRSDYIYFVYLSNVCLYSIIISLNCLSSFANHLQFIVQSECVNPFSLYVGHQIKATLWPALHTDIWLAMQRVLSMFCNRISLWILDQNESSQPFCDLWFHSLKKTLWVNMELCKQFNKINVPSRDWPVLTWLLQLIKRVISLRSKCQDKYEHLINMRELMNSCLQPSWE